MRCCEAAPNDPTLRCPGSRSLEIPSAARTLANLGQVDAIIPSAVCSARNCYYEAIYNEVAAASASRSRKQAFRTALAC